MPGQLTDLQVICTLELIGACANTSQSEMAALLREVLGEPEKLRAEFGRRFLALPRFDQEHVFEYARKLVKQ